MVFKLDNVEPTIKNAQSGSYRLLVPFALVWKKDVKKAAMQFADYLFTTGAQKIMLLNGVMPAN